MTKRERLYPEIKRLREIDGLRWREIGERLSLSKSTVFEYYSDPDATMVRARKAKSDGVCVGCGAITIGDGSYTPERCLPCDHAYKRSLTRAYILASFAEWVERFGVPPAAYDWNPSMCRAQLKRSDDCFGRALARHLSTGRPWPPTASVANHFGSWNAGLRAAGLQPLAPKERWIGHRGMAALREDREAA